MIDIGHVKNLPSMSIVLGSGRCFTSRCIALHTCEWGQLIDGHWFSHAGLVFKHMGQQLVIESTTQSSLACCIQNKKLSGVQAHPIEDWCKAYNGAVWAIPYKGEVDMGDEDRLHQLVMEQLGKPYDMVGCLATGTVFAKHWYHYDPKHFFCSELVTWLLRRATYIDPVSVVGGPSCTKHRQKYGYITPAELALKAPRRPDYAMVDQISV